ncbi:MAG: fused MFS/spermidine synthase [Thermomicrobiales bacterium]
MSAPPGTPPADTASSRTQPPVEPWLLRALVFTGGMASVGTETSAARLIAPYFGESTFIWANIIGFTLTFLALGYWLGGRIADTHPRPWLLFATTTVAALWAGLTPLISRPLLSASVDAFANVSVGAFYGSLVGILLILAVPITLLGFVSPFAVRLSVQDVAHTGQASGGIYALGTIGSIAGSFLPTLLLIPLVGTMRTFLILGALLLVPSLIGLFRLRLWTPGALSVGTATAVTVASLAGAPHPIRPVQDGTFVYETESRENYIQVTEDNGTMMLSLNDGHAVHSIYNPDHALSGGPWDYFMLGPLFGNHPQPASISNALLIGLAGGTVAHQLTLAYGPIPIDGVEIDPEIARVGEQYFGMTEPNLTVIVQDGRYTLRTSDRAYDLIGVDAYRQPYIPFQLTTQEFFQEIDAHLTDNGAAVINVGRTQTDYRLVDVIASTMKSVFPNVYVIDTARYDNSIVIATKSPTALTNFAANVAAQPEGSLVRTVGDAALTTGNVREVSAVTTVFTDDHAPVERVVDTIILDAAREETEDTP